MKILSPAEFHLNQSNDILIRWYADATQSHPHLVEIGHSPPSQVMNTVPITKQVQEGEICLKAWNEGSNTMRKVGQVRITADVGAIKTTYISPAPQ